MSEAASAAPVGFSHFRNPLTEQRELLAGAVAQFSPAGARYGVLEVSGPDRKTFLHSLLSQDILSIATVETREALLLDPQGHIEAAFLVVDDGTSAWLLSDASVGQRILPWFEKMRFRSKVEFADRTGDFAQLTYFGEQPPAALAALVEGEKSVAFQDPWPETSTGGYRYAKTAAGPWGVRIALVPVSNLAGLKAGLPESSLLAGDLALEALRIAAYRPSFGLEVDERSLPHELDWLSTAVHMTKGCYRGQESVAKIHNLGHPPRRLTLLHLDGSGTDLPSAGATVYHPAGPDKAEKPVGKVSAAAQHFEMGPIALAVLSRSTPLEATLEVATETGRVSASQEVIVPPDAGAAAGIAQQRKNLLGSKR